MSKKSFKKISHVPIPVPPAEPVYTELGTVDLDVFNGKTFWLSAVDYETIEGESHYDSAANAMRFALNGRIYVAIEDPNDGYRSCLNKIIMVDGPPIKNTFPPCEVRAEKNTGNSDRTYSPVDDLMDFIDVNTGLLVLQVGTSNTDDYYPSYVANFIPENMFANRDKVR